MTIKREEHCVAHSQEDVRWAAVLSRDATADAAFVYCVRSTGIYCRPTCPSRRPQRKNVLFHDDWRAAELGGYRPCHRCRPRDQSRSAALAELVEAACRRIDGAQERVSLAALAAEAGLSQFHFQRVFKSFVGMSPKHYAQGRRAELMRAELADGRTRVLDAAMAAGFGSSGRFYDKMRETLGMDASVYRKGGAGETIRFALGTSSLGVVLAAVSAIGVCAIFLGSRADALVQSLHDRFPNARLIGDDEAFTKLVAQVVALVETGDGSIDLPLDIRGTAFQQKVWRALLAIPKGETLTYSELAGRIGASGSARAVAQACAANSIAIAIPCHRVIRADGSPSGYRWGVERKQELLARERKSK